MAISNFLQERWSLRINEVLRLNHVLAQPQIVNRDYTADVQDARKFHTHTLADLGVVNYDPYPNNDGTAISYKQLSDRRVTGEMDQVDIIAWMVEDIARLQSNANYMTSASQNAGYRLRENIEKFISRQLTSGIATSSNTKYYLEPTNFERGSTYDSTSTGFTLQDSSTAAQTANVGARGFVSAVVQARVQMSKDGVPDTGRVLLVPPEFVHVFWNDDRFEKDTSESEMRNANGWMGRFMGFNIIESNYLTDDEDLEASPTEADRGKKLNVIATHPSLYTFALQQPVSFEAMRSENRYGIAARAVSVYGGVYLNKVLTTVAGTPVPGAIRIAVDVKNTSQPTT